MALAKLTGCFALLAQRTYRYEITCRSRALRLVVAEHAVWVRAVERAAGEVLDGHTTAVAQVVGVAALAAPADLPLAQVLEEQRFAPDAGEAAWIAHVAAGELGS